MKPCDVVELQKSKRKDPSFFIEYMNVGRGFIKNPQNTNSPHVIHTRELVVWRIEENELLAIGIENHGVFHNAETYLICWTFKYTEKNDDLRESTIFFFWKGSKAVKSFSPLPPDFDNDNSIVHRITQWSEPAIFFHIFPNPIIVFDGKCSEFNPSKKHLFISCGELKEELHLYELPFFKKNLRSRGIFIIVDPQKENIYIWKGLSITEHLERTFEESNLLDTLRTSENSWKHYKHVIIKEHENNEIFEGDTITYWHYEKTNSIFSPRLFFLNSITGEFLATEAEYPLSSENHVAAFPFLQSHLSMTDLQPGLFLLDNNRDIWLITSDATPEELYALAIDTAKNYVKEKEKQLNKSVLLKFAKLGEEPIEFINIFPYWN